MRNYILTVGKYLTAGGICFILVLLALYLYPQLHGYYSSGTCFPVAYPDGTRPRPKSAELHTYVTNDPIDDVVSFYKHQLEAEAELETGNHNVWENEQLENLNNPNVLFRCLSSHGNGYTAESACIYIQKQGGQTHIETIWYFWNMGVPFPCPLDIMSTG